MWERGERKQPLQWPLLGGVNISEQLPAGLSECQSFTSTMQTLTRPMRQQMPNYAKG